VGGEGIEQHDDDILLPGWSSKLPGNKPPNDTEGIVPNAFCFFLVYS
jgi:hypothetical protein